MPLSDHERTLLHKAQRGDRSAFSDFYLRFQATVYLEVYAIVRSASEADDITSETFLRAWNAIHKFEDRGFSIEAWLKTIGRNLALTYMKRRRQECTGQELEQLVDPALLPEEYVETEVESATVREALLGLPEIQRQVLTMRFYQDLTYRQVADVVGKPEGTVRVIQHRALRSLKDLLVRGGFLREPPHVVDPVAQGGRK